MIKKIINLLLITSTVTAQDKGQFESYSNTFYGEILKESNIYNKTEKDPYKSFKMNFDGKEIPQSLDEFTIVEAEEPISQGNTGTCWCFELLHFMKVKSTVLVRRLLTYQNFTQFILNILKKQEDILTVEEILI